LCSLVLLTTADMASASCNVIPGTARTFRSGAALVDRPFAGPGEWVELGFDSTCHGAASGFTATASDYVVTVMFRPPAAEARAVVLAADCAQIATQLAACGGVSGLASTTCIDATAASAPPSTSIVNRGGSNNLAESTFPSGSEPNQRRTIDSSVHARHTASGGTLKIRLI
jgi:hypothetical protein